MYVQYCRYIHKAKKKDSGIIMYCTYIGMRCNVLWSVEHRKAHLNYRNVCIIINTNVCTRTVLIILLSSVLGQVGI
jgi:hypothetical protein